MVFNIGQFIFSNCFTVRFSGSAIVEHLIHVEGVENLPLAGIRCFPMNLNSSHPKCFVTKKHF